MKLKLLLSVLIITLLPISVTFGAEIGGLTQFGSFTVDGGTSHTGLAIGGDIVIKSFDDGFVIKERITQFSVRNGESSQMEGTFILTVMQQTLSDHLWNFYIAGKTGVFNQTIDGDDVIWSVTGLEIGCSPWRKRLNIFFSADLMPVGDKGDKVFLSFGTSFTM